MQLKIIFAFIIIINQVNGKLITNLAFNFSRLTVNCFDCTINTTTYYSFDFDRTIDNSGFPTAYASNPVPAGSDVIITFPSNYAVSTSYTWSVISFIKIASINS